jgi:hypothetical protein
MIKEGRKRFQLDYRSVINFDEVTLQLGFGGSLYD